MDKIYIFGHRKPDTDSVTSAIALEYLKKSLGIYAEARVLSEINDETQFDLDKALEELKKIVGKEKYKEITELNFDKVINDALLEPYKIVEHKHLFKKEKII